MDATDTRILAARQQHPAASIRELSAITGIPKSTLDRRLTALKLANPRISAETTTSAGVRIGAREMWDRVLLRLLEIVEDDTMGTREVIAAAKVLLAATRGQQETEERGKTQTWAEMIEELAERGKQEQSEAEAA